MLYLHVCLCTTYIPGTEKAEEGVGFPGTRVTGSCELLYCWELNLGFLEKQPVLLTVEPLIQPIYMKN